MCKRALPRAPLPSRTDTIVCGDVAVVSIVASDDWASPSIIIKVVSRPRGRGAREGRVARDEEEALLSSSSAVLLPKVGHREEAPRVKDLQMRL